MSDLSNLLGSVYGGDNPDGAPVHHEPSAHDRGPAWDDEARLDEAFQHWTPGPGPDAPAHEREMLADTSAGHAPAPESADPDHALAAALSAALAAETRREPVAPPLPRFEAEPRPMAPVTAPAPAPAVAPAPAPAVVHHVAAAPMPAMGPEVAFVAPVAAPVAAPPAVASWRFGDDDIYPMGRRAKKR